MMSTILLVALVGCCVEASSDYPAVQVQTYPARYGYEIHQPGAHIKRTDLVDVVPYPVGDYEEDPDYPHYYYKRHGPYRRYYGRSYSYPVRTEWSYKTVIPGATAYHSQVEHATPVYRSYHYPKYY